jgi:hypothetical protein
MRSTSSIVARSVARASSSTDDFDPLEGLIGLLARRRDLGVGVSAGEMYDPIGVRVDGRTLGGQRPIGVAALGLQRHVGLQPLRDWFRVRSHDRP